VSINDSLRISSSALLADQAALQVISHNIANVNTDGYHKQSVQLTANPSSSTASGLTLGTGVTVSDVIRSYNQMTEHLLLEEKSDYEYHSTLAGALGELEGLVSGTDDSSLSTQLQEFWDAWQELADDPSSTSSRNILLETAGSLADTIKTLVERVTEFREGIAGGDGSSSAFSGAVTDEVATLNSLAAEIAELNDRITRLGTTTDCNDLEDKRDALIRELSEKADITVGSDFTISIDGQMLVSSDGKTCNPLTQTSSAPIAFEMNGVSVTISSGSIGAWVEAAGEADALLETLNTLAAELISSVNSAHTTGYDRNGDLGTEFFSGSDATDIALNISDPDLAAAAATSDASGDGDNALLIAHLADSEPERLGNATFQEYFDNALVSLGSKVTTEENAADDAELAVNSLLNTIQSESGVSEDEEMVNMISFQSAYQAAAKMISTLNEIMETLINMK